MEIQLFGAAKTVTGSCYSLKIKEAKILVDCGMFQGRKEQVAINYQDFDFNPKEYTSLILTHAHLDHCGRIPKLIKAGFRGKIFATAATRDLAYEIMLDSAGISAHEVEHENKRRVQQGLPPREPIYTEDDVTRAMKLFKTVSYHKEFLPAKNIIAMFYDAGHILGSASLQLEITENNKKASLVFSGDLGQVDAPIVNNPEPIEKADYVFIESTYGNMLHPDIKERKQRLRRIIQETYDKKGKLMIPSFAIERTQELLFALNELVENDLIPKIDVYIDTPLGARATDIFEKHPECYDEEIKKVMETGDNPFSFPNLIYSKKTQESIDIDRRQGPLIVISGSGMCTGGRIKHHIRHNISDPKNTILFIGFQAHGTLGHYIKNGAKRIRLLGTEVDVKAKVETIESFSAHADYKELLNWLKHFQPKPKIVFITHGEEKNMQAFAKRIQELGLKAKTPEMREKIVLP